MTKYKSKPFEFGLHLIYFLIKVPKFNLDIFSFNIIPELSFIIFQLKYVNYGMKYVICDMKLLGGLHCSLNLHCMALKPSLNDQVKTTSTRGVQLMEQQPDLPRCPLIWV